MKSILSLVGNLLGGAFILTMMALFAYYVLPVVLVILATGMAIAACIFVIGCLITVFTKDSKPANLGKNPYGR